jgi:S-layer homology domain
MKAFVFGALFTALIVTGTVEAQVPAGGEFRVNDATDAPLSLPRVAADPTGAFVVVWSDYMPPAAIRGRRFDPTGAPRGVEFTVNETSVAYPWPDVAVDATGRALAVWSSVGGDAGTKPGVFGRLVDSIGRFTGPQFTIAAGVAYEPSVAVTPSGFVVVWSTDSTLDDSGGVKGRRIDVAGNPLGPEFAVNARADGLQYAPSVAASESGSFVVAWVSYDGAGPKVLGRRFDAGGGHLGREIQVNTAPPFNALPAMALAGDGSFVVAWTSGYDVRGRRFTAAGVAVGVEFTVNSSTAYGLYSVSAVSDKSGNFTVLWEAGPVGGLDVFGRRYTASGAPRGAEFPVNTEAKGDQLLPDVAIDVTGNLFAAWIGQDQSSQFQVFGQRLGGLVASEMAVEDGGNDIVEVADSFTLVTTWRNVNGTAQTFDGRATGVAVPAGLDVELSPDAAYGTVPDGSAGNCSGLCFEGSLTGKRPEGHVDIRFVESIEPDAQGQAKRWRVHVGGTFADVPGASLYYRDVETLVHHGITGGCALDAYCPSSSTTREQMAVFTLVGREGAGYLPPACAKPMFTDVPASSMFCPWVEEVARRGAAGGCGSGQFCPDVPITREQMAVLVLRVLDPLLDPPACTDPVFVDVPASSPYCRWIEELARRDAVMPCGAEMYCPLSPVTREQMALFIAGTFKLELYGPSVGHVPRMPDGSPAPLGVADRSLRHRR